MQESALMNAPKEGSKDSVGDEENKEDNGDGTDENEIKSSVYNNALQTRFATDATQTIK